MAKVPYQLTPADRNLLIAWRLVLEIERVVCRFHFQHQHIGNHLLELHALYTVIGSELEGKSCRLSKLAHYLDCPRANLERALGDLVASGHIKKEGFEYHSKHIKNRAAGRAVDALILHAASEIAQNGQSDD